MITNREYDAHCVLDLDDSFQCLMFNVVSFEELCDIGCRVSYDVVDSSPTLHIVTSNLSFLEVHN